MITFHELTIKKTHDLLVNKEISAFDLTRELLEYISDKDKEIGAYLSIRHDEALAEANETDKKIAAREEIDYLAGIPLAIKDNMLIKDWPATAASKILKNYRATYDATVIKKLKEAGAIFIGKANMDEFAMGSSTENSAYQLTKNPLDPTTVPGGSSGGVAAAVASHQAIAGLGSDTGGSIRQPAAFCGLVGLKPTYGAVSRFGLMALASSLDQIGPLTKNTEDSALLFEKICGEDKHDATSKAVSFSFSDIQKTADLKKMKIGVIKECFEQNLDEDLKNSIQNSINQLKTLGAEVEEVSIPHIGASLACYYIILPAEVSANLARYDGLRYAVNELGGTLKERYFKNRGRNFGPEVRRRIVLGTFVLSAGYYDAYYLKAKKVQKLIKQEFDKAFERYQLLLSPTTPSSAFKIGEKVSDPLAMYLSDIFTVPANIAGLPAISLPIWGKNKLPYGLQLIAPALEEKRLFQAGILLEKIK
ncbi:MAG TPA: Asp-tRNA(Asn)/Glu-tRNA(Gln) amidotransferase subunit GatA [Candidatus Paceibacterota bacterium]|nr:Asp-tRNA(Asn)/Glu-tRNA(Gln) amidotransferase subunit GatA [Candidatus Paceibacterota bacterium]